ncbi:hypothetical protein BLNAU_10621 [Blattamonas nauphoetae]|uniref:Uncharacterized protein n=1 Tax=Blattamonas nauphoetae TaxID=2049346 RepID=A0ABQ9XS47_9EUKA|nr:hypothetical protein BLNAU_10621 [Blattamonas nauphoetae]
MPSLILLISTLSTISFGAGCEYGVDGTAPSPGSCGGPIARTKATRDATLLLNQGCSLEQIRYFPDGNTKASALCGECIPGADYVANDEGSCYFTHFCSDTGFCHPIQEHEFFQSGCPASSINDSHLFCGPGLVCYNHVCLQCIPGEVDHKHDLECSNGLWKRIETSRVASSSILSVTMHTVVAIVSTSFFLIASFLFFFPCVTRSKCCMKHFSIPNSFAPPNTRQQPYYNQYHPPQGPPPQQQAPVEQTSQKKRLPASTLSRPKQPPPQRPNKDPRPNQLSTSFNRPPEKHELVQQSDTGSMSDSQDTYNPLPQSSSSSGAKDSRAQWNVSQPSDEFENEHGMFNSDEMLREKDRFARRAKEIETKTQSSSQSARPNRPAPSAPIPRPSTSTLPQRDDNKQKQPSMQNISQRTPSRPPRSSVSQYIPRRSLPQHSQQASPALGAHNKNQPRERTPTRSHSHKSQTKEYEDSPPPQSVVDHTLSHPDLFDCDSEVSFSES